MQDIVGIFESIRGYIRKSVGIGPFRVLSPGDTLDQRAYAIQAKGGDLTYNATTAEGDDIGSGSLLQQDASIVGNFNSVTCESGSSGDAVVYLF